MFITLFASLLLTPDQGLSNPVLNDENLDFSYKAPLAGESDFQFDNCPMTRSNLIIMKKSNSGDSIAVREPISTFEISLEKSDKRARSHH